jgi:GNAT superfamily N-acetyltransferase
MPAQARDAEWIKKLYAKNKKHLGSFDLFMSWQKYIKERKGFFKTISLVVGKKSTDVGFIRYSYMKKYMSYVVHEIAVDEKFLGQGFGTLLLKHVHIPVLLKCNKDNEVGNAFYKKIGMDCAGLTHTKKGVEQIIWTRTKPW